MKAVFTSKQGHKVIVEPLKKQTEEELRKKAEKIMKFQSINAKLIIEK
jgi:hypothetical protein